MQFIMMGGQFEQELKPLVKSFFQTESIEVEVQYFEEELAWPAVKGGKLLYCTVGDSETEDNPEDFLELEPFEVEYGLVLHLGAERFHPAFFRDYYVTDWTEEPMIESKSRKTARNQIARAVYRILSKETGRSLPWGILTGVRPTKLVFELAEAGMPEVEIQDHMKEEYGCSTEKIKVSLQVTSRERELLGQFDYRKGYSLYIGIPFCPTTCHYCSFTSFPLAGFSQLVEPYLTALFLEMDAAASLFPKRPLHTVYIGGGTPTTLSTKQLERLICHIKKCFDLSFLREFTVEAGRPDSITADKLKRLKELGISRISINPQSMNDKTLEAIGRRHTAAQINEAFYLARNYGHDNINMDLIIGLTGETPEDVSNTLSGIRILQPDSLTVHTLALKRAARLNIEHQGFRDIGAQGVPEMQRRTYAFAAEQEYLPYYLYRQKNMSENLENTGFARYGKEGLYNILIMEEKQTILALGAGGSSKFIFQGSEAEQTASREKQSDSSEAEQTASWRKHPDGGTSQGVRIERVENVKNLNHYIERIDEMIRRKQEFLDVNGAGLFQE